MKICSRVVSRAGLHKVSLQTNEKVQELGIPPKQSGFGSSVNGGELLFLALATCYCNDVYREAGKRGIKIERLEVEVSGDFGAEGEPASNVTCRARVSAQGSEADIRELMNHTDRVSEIQNTVRAGTAVKLEKVEVTAL